MPREVAEGFPGPRGALVYLLVAALLVPTALVYARLGRAFPEDGGPYLYAQAAFGDNAAFAVGFTTFVSALFSTATVLVGFVEGIASALGITSQESRCLAELGLLSLLTASLSLGLRPSAVAWSLVTILKSVPLLTLPIFALLRSPQGTSITVAARPTAAFGAALAVSFALQGFEIVPLPAAQVKNPRTSVPLATVGSLAFAALVYAALHAACVRALPDLRAHELPLADAARVYGGEALYRLMIVTTSVSAFGITVGMVAMTPRYLAPLGDESAFGFGLLRENARAVPLRAFAVTYVLLCVVLVVSAAFGSLRHLLELSSLSVTLQYAVTALSLLRLASRRAASLLPRDRWPAPLALLGCAALAMGASRLEVPIVGGLVAAGFALRWIRRRAVYG